MLRLTVIVLAILITGAAHSENPPPRSGEFSQPIQKDSTASKKPPSKDQRGTEKMPFVIKSIPTEKTPEQAKEDRQEREDKTANDRGMTLYTGALALLTFLLVCIGSIQGGLFYWQLKLIRESLVDTKTSADAANKAADAAERTVNTMKDTAERQLRAYALVSSAAIVNVREGQTTNTAFTTSKIYVSIKNFGHTPATAIQVTYAICTKEFPLLTDLDGDQLLQVIQVIAPGDTFTSHLEIPLMNSHELAGQLTALYIYGNFHYCDGFHQDRVTHFRFMRKGGDDWSRKGDMETCQNGNDVT